MQHGYKTSQIAKLFGLHGDTLRYYEEQGLVQPARLPNGYRSYSVQDICTLSIIRTLRRLEMPVERIARYMRTRSVGSTLALLDEEQGLIDTRIAELRRAKQEVRQRGQALRSSRTAVVDTPTLLELPPRKCYRLETPMLPEPEVDVELKRLEQNRPELRRVVGARRMGAVIGQEAVARGEYEHYSAVFFMGEQLAASDGIIEGGLYGSILYRGAYTGIAAALARLLEYLCLQGAVPCGDVLELYLVDVHDTCNTGEYLTEVQVPVKQNMPKY